jgi:signal transduction histidine kinase
VYLVWVLLRKREKGLKSLFLFNVSIVLWVLSIFSITRTTNLEIAIWFARLTFSTTAIAVASYTSFFSSYADEEKSILQKVINILGFLMALFAFTPFLVREMIAVEGSNYPAVEFGILALIYVFFVVIGIGYLIYSIFKLRKISRGLEYLQMSYITIGMVLASIFAIFTNVILPIITKSSASAFWGPVAVSIFSVITTYTVTSHRLFSVKFLLGKLTYYASLTVIPFLFFVLLLNLLPTFELTKDVFLTYVIGIGTSILFVLLYSILGDFLNRKLNPVVGFKSERAEEIREKFLRSISTELNIEKLGIVVLKAIDVIFDLDKSGVIIFDSDNATILYKKLREFQDRPLDNRNLLQVIYYWDEIGHSTVIAKEELLSSKIDNPYLQRILSFMEKDDIEIILPLNRKVHLNGVIVLGRKNNKNPFTVEDIDYLEELIVSFSVAFSRSILYSQVQDLNLSLQQKVSEQTKELQEKIEQLEEARRKESDMIDIMGHELRTPATVVKLNAELLENFTEDLLNNRDKFELYLKRIKTAVDNEIKLINTLLSSAKLEGDKIELNPERVNIVEDVEMAIHGHELEAKERGLKLINNLNNKTPDIYADHARVIEVLNNLIDNAVKYTERGTITLESFFDEDSVSISVEDTGKGIPKNELANLGQKFYRIENYISEREGNPNLVRPGGTGLGLYVTFGLVKRMGGEIKVDSQLNKGTKFTFTLPRYKDQDNGTERVQSKNMFERLGLKR